MKEEEEERRVHGKCKKRKKCRMEGKSQSRRTR